MQDERDKTMLVLDNTVDLLRNLLQYERSQIEGVQHQIQRIQSALEDLSAYMEKVTKGSKLRNVTRFFGASGISDNLRKKRDAVTMAFEAMNITMTTIRSSADVRRASSSIYDKEGRDFWITSFGDAVRLSSLHTHILLHVLLPSHSLSLSISLLYRLSISPLPLLSLSASHAHSD